MTDEELKEYLKELDEKRHHSDGTMDTVFIVGVDDIGTSRNNTTTYARVESATI